VLAADPIWSEWILGALAGRAALIYGSVGVRKLGVRILSLSYINGSRLLAVPRRKGGAVPRRRAGASASPS